MKTAKKRLTEIEKEIRKQTAEKFLTVVESKYEGNRSAAARALRLTRQRFQLYLEGRTAGPELLVLACEIWGIEFAIDSIRLSSEQLRRRKSSIGARRTPLQLDLFNQPQTAEGDNFVVVVKRSASKRLAVEVEFNLAEST